VSRKIVAADPIDACVNIAAGSRYIGKWALIARGGGVGWIEEPVMRQVSNQELSSCVFVFVHVFTCVGCLCLFDCAWRRRWLDCRSSDDAGKHSRIIIMFTVAALSGLMSQ
jgi:hypothetical protein